MQKNNILKGHLPYLLVLLVIAIVSHLQWFNLFSVITWGDWYYWPSSIVGHLIYSWTNWINFFDLGYPNVQINFLFFKSIWSLLFTVGVGYDVSSKLTFFIPIAVLSFFSPYLLSFKISRNKNISFIAAIYYGTITYGLFVQPPIQFVYALAPLIVFLFLEAIRKENFLNWILFSLVFWIGVVYEPRMTIIVSFVLFILFIFIIKPRKKLFLYICLSILIEMGLNAFWIVPTFLGDTLRSISLITSRDIFGNSLFDISHSFTIYNWLWTGGYPNKEFVQQGISFYFWMFPFIVFLPFLFRNIKNKTLLITFSLISLIGIFLSKQSALPFVGIYEYLYKHLPGFSFFREASKFYLLISLGYLGLITISLVEIKKKSIKAFFIIGIILLSASLYNLKPLITGEMGTLFVSREIPKDYSILGKFINSNDNYFRTLWVPIYSRWSMFSENHPEIAFSNLIDSSWSSLIKRSNPSYTDGKLFTNLLKQKNINNLLSQSSIKYVVIPLEDNKNDDNFFKIYGVDKNLAEKEIKKNPFYKQINIGTKEVTIFETNSYKPHIYSTEEKETIAKTIVYKEVSYKVISPNTYRIILTNVKNQFYINFSESFSRQWKLRIGNYNRLSTLFMKNYSLNEKNHMQNDSTLNSFFLDPKIICTDFKCSKNLDGSYNFEVTLYYSSQVYLYLGLIISGATLIIVLCFLSFIFGKNLYERKNK